MYKSSVPIVYEAEVSYKVAFVLLNLEIFARREDLVPGSEDRSLAVAAQNETSYRAATARERSSEHVFSTWLSADR